MRPRVALQVVFLILSIAAGLWILHRIERVVVVLILATLFAYVVDPLVRLAERPVHVAGRQRRIPRGAAIALVYFLMAAGVCGAVAMLLPRIGEQIADLTARAPAYADSFVAWAHGWSRYYERLRIPIEVRHSIDESVVAASAAGVEYARGSLWAVMGMLSNGPWLLLIPILGFFLLKDGTMLRQIVLKALPHRGQLRSHRLFEEINSTLAAYMRAQLLACVLVGTLSGIGFAVLGIPYSVLLGVLAGALEFIPLVGPLLVAFLAALAAALHSPIRAAWALGFLAVLRVVEDYVIYPRLLRRGVHLHPLAVIVAVLAGAELDGVAGVFLAVPVVAVGAVAIRHWMDWSGNEPA